MRYKLEVRGKVIVNEDSMERALVVFQEWLRSVQAGQDIGLVVGGIKGVTDLDLTLDFASGRLVVGKASRSRRTRRGGSPADGVLPIDPDRNEGS
jgi:hypothetical protein